MDAAIRTMVEIKIDVLRSMPNNNFAYGQALGFLNGVFTAGALTYDEYNKFHEEINDIVKQSDRR